jgi:ElaB/YqjD/DUF883 family membrane-anchored ribosome-binding protein
MMERTAGQSAVLVDELRKVVVQADALLQALSEDKNEAVGVLRERVRASVDSAKARLSEIEQQAAAMAQRASVSTQAYVRENPWTVAGGALATGLVLGAAFIGYLRTGRSTVDPSSTGDGAVS